MLRRIAITQRVQEAVLVHERRDALSQDWAAWAFQTLPGSVLVPVPNLPAAVQNWWAGVAPDALILSGGNDLGDAPERDRTEIELIDLALADGCPILGVCRGLQMLNSYFGGSLTEDISVVGHDHVAKWHDLKICDDRFGNLAPAGPFQTNSYHQQGVLTGQMATQLICFAEAPGGVVEGFYHPDRSVLGIQWHPEREGPENGFDVSVLRPFLSATKGAGAATGGSKATK